jgi:DNA/RNA-binding domain of Phe-tRNA-synthetase-like protein
MNMITYRISRVMLTGVVGVVLVACQTHQERLIESGEMEPPTEVCWKDDNGGLFCRMEYSNERSDAAAAEVTTANAGAAAQIQELGEQAAETAVEAYTEEPRWEGATDYSQACSSSSGDLGC